MRYKCAVCLLALLVALAHALNAPASGQYTIKINPAGGVKIDPGETYSLSVDIEPKNLIEHVVAWTSDNDYVASVSSKGVVTGRAAGRTTVRATLESGAQASCPVTVSGRAVTELALNITNIELQIGSGLQLTYTMNDDADDKRVKWFTDDASVATVSDTGVVTAVGYGTAVITLLAVNGMSATASVFVPSDVKSIMLDPESALVAVGAYIQLDAYVFPGNARNRNLTWESSNKKVALVDSNGVVTGVSVGSATIRVSTQNGVSASAEITVAKLPTSITLNAESVVLSRQNRTFQLEARIEPASARDCVLTWETSDPDVVLVRGGKLTAQGYGTAVVSARAQNQLSAEVIVTVAEIAQAIEFTQSEYSLFAGGAACAPEYALTPSYGYAGELIWEVDDPDVCHVSAGGEITGLKSGETTLTVTAVGGAKASARVRVHEDVRSITLSHASLEMRAHESRALGIAFAPDESQSVPVIWSSADNSVAVVMDGVIYARAPGETVISASAADGAIRAECAVTVGEGELTKKRIALTFDNGPGAATQSILNVLDAYGVRATFFLCGVSIERYPDIAALYSGTPHELGNHTYDNRSLNSMRLSDVAINIERTDELIVKAAGRQATVLRAPDANLPRALFNSFLDTRPFVGWTTDTGDMLASASAQSVTDKALMGAFDTAILTFHDASAHTGEALEGIILALIMDGYEFLTVSELIEAVGLSPGSVFTTKR